MSSSNADPAGSGPVVEAGSGPVGKDGASSAAVSSWLDSDAVVDCIDLGERAWVDVVRGLCPRGDEVGDDLRTSVAWSQGRVFRYERWVDEPRLSAMQAGSQRHPALVEVQTWITRRYRTPFDGVALALYRDQRDSVAWHRDRELRFLEDTVIGVLSLGATRPFLLRPLGDRRRDEDDTADVIDLAPGSGDLLVMGGRCQAGWLHAVPKSRRPMRARISAQWRWTSRRGPRDRNPPYSAPRHFSR